VQWVSWLIQIDDRVNSFLLFALFFLAYSVINSKVDLIDNMYIRPYVAVVLSKSCLAKTRPVAIQRRSCDAATTDANAFRFARQHAFFGQIAVAIIVWSNQVL
jgi:hypothetical protein